MLWARLCTPFCEVYVRFCVAVKGFRNRDAPWSRHWLSKTQGKVVDIGKYSFMLSPMMHPSNAPATKRLFPG